ncbi:MAG: LCP family protein [Parcubacteria group bacterium]|jgi:LCP family protein required for cell wall assembly
MTYFRNNNLSNKNTRAGNYQTPKVKFYKKRWFKIVGVILILLVIGGGAFAWKTGSVLTKISNGGLLSSIAHNIPGVKDELKGEKDGRINILVLGMRGADLPGGGLLADTIMVVSVKPAENKASIISIPRDLYVTVPGTQDRQKINAVHAYGEENGKEQGLEQMKKAVTEVTGLPIHYAASINFTGFKQLVDAIGGVDVTLDKPFEETMQFNEAKVCDPNVFTVPTGKYETKKDTTKTGKIKIVAQYPLCTNPKTECGGDFKLPAGKNTLNGDQALCFARSRVTSSDFERAKRQQLVMQLVKDKMLSIGTLADFSKVNGVLDSLGDNVRTDMQLWEMQKLYDIYKKVPNPEIHQRVLEDSEEGLLYAPTEGVSGYILLPRGDNYDKIHDMAQNIFTMPEQKDIKPKI